MQKQFTWTMYRGKPAVFDTTARVYYTGYKTMREAIKHAEELNTGK